MNAIDTLFDRLLAKSGSDLHLSPGYPPMLRLRGQLVADGDSVLSSADIEALLMPLLSPTQHTTFTTTGDLDFAHQHGANARFRANYMKKLTGTGAVFRAIPTKILTLDQLKRGVTAVSGGNHAVAVAYAARELGTTAKVVMPSTANSRRRELCAQYGAEVVIEPDIKSAFAKVNQIKDRLKGKKAALIVCGANIDVGSYQKHMETTP